MIASAATDRPKLRRGIRLHNDTVREAWVLLGPERVIQLDPIAYEILKRVDGSASIGDIIDDLAEQFVAPRERIEQDVIALLDSLVEKGFMEFSS